MQNKQKKISSLLRFIGVLMFPFMGVGIVKASTGLEISGWIPYWRSTQGVESIRLHLPEFTEVNPFLYTVREDGTLSQASLLTNPEWVQLQTQSKQAGVRFIPTVMWSGADAIDATMKDPQRRAAHIQAIAREVYTYGLDGIDIDYENKFARTRPYFSQFLKELYEAIGYDKWVMCTIEARTPLDSRYSSPESIPTDIEYANDLSVINQYCDRVRIMAYDQGRIDLKLNSANEDPYIPVADPRWVEKVIAVAAQEIKKEKIMIGVPTYGYEYDMFSSLSGSGKNEYSQLWSFNPTYAVTTAQKLGIVPVRNSAYELSLVFAASLSPEPVKPLPTATRVLSWSDAEAIQKKIEIAAVLGVRGVSIFKIDGGQDEGLWNVLSKYENAKEGKKTPNFELAQAEINGDEMPVGHQDSAALAAPERNLSPGEKSEAVKTIQKILNKLGFTVADSGGGSSGNETTYFGSATYRALIRFQQANAISPAIGHYGPKTRAAMQKL